MSQSKAPVPAIGEYDGHNDLNPVAVTLPVGVWRTLVFSLLQQFGVEEQQAALRQMLGIPDDEEIAVHNDRLKRRVGYAIQAVTVEAAKADPDSFEESVATVAKIFAPKTLDYLRAQEKVGTMEREAIEAELTVEAIAQQNKTVQAINARMREGATAEAWTEAGAEAEAELRKAAGIKPN